MTSAPACAEDLELSTPVPLIFVASDPDLATSNTTERQHKLREDNNIVSQFLAGGCLKASKAAMKIYVKPGTPKAAGVL